MILAWKSSWVGKECRIFRDKVIVGLLKTSPWSGNAYGELNGHMLRFKPQGFWKYKTIILDIEGKTELGRIEYNLWKGTAVITYQQIGYEWAFGSWKGTSWNVTGSGETARFNKTSNWKNEGSIGYENMPAPIILAAMYVQVQFFKMTVAS
jgi:hypothetical protein